MPLLNLYYFTFVKYGDQNYYLIRHILIKVQLSKFTLNSVNIHKNVPWYTENKACRAELGRYPLSIDIKASLLCYWQRLEQKSDNPVLNEAFSYARNHSQFNDLLNSDETIQMYYKNEVIKNQQCVKNTRSSIKQQLQKKFSQDWFKARNDISDSSRQKYTNNEIEKDYRWEEYLKIFRIQLIESV